MNEQRRPYYVDFRESGGVVHSEPTKMLPELVFTGRTKSQLDIELERHEKMVQEVLGASRSNGVRLEGLNRIARPVFIRLFLPSPGLTQLKDDFHTGWFYTNEDDKVYCAFNIKGNISFSPYVQNKHRASYFLLDKKEGEFWNERITKGPLIIEEIDKLFLSPGIESHPSYQNLARLNLKELTDKVSFTVDSFENAFNTFDRNDTSTTRREFLRENFLELQILERVHRRSHNAAREEVRESMEKNEITVFPLDQEGCAVRYRTNLKDNRQTRTKIVPLPHSAVKHFQRYGRLGQRPMTKAEFESKYRALVDPNTKLQF